MEAAVLSIIGIVIALLLLGICVGALEQEQETRTQDKGDAYRLRDQSTRCMPN
jgi:hypothetical protein